MNGIVLQSRIMKKFTADSSRFIGFYLLFISMISCTPKQQEPIVVECINGSIVDTDAPLLNPTQLQIDGDILWISDFGANPMITATSIKTGKIAANILYKGRGPFEGMLPRKRHAFLREQIRYFNRKDKTSVRQTGARSGNRPMPAPRRLPPTGQRRIQRGAIRMDRSRPSGNSDVHGELSRFLGRGKEL